jgi:SulP family sulfate permease
MSSSLYAAIILSVKNLLPDIPIHKAWPPPHLKDDLVAGITVATVIIPNAMGYAILAGLPPVMGLYAALPAICCAALWGSSSFVITAPVGVVSLLTATALSPFADPQSGAFITLAITLALMTGIIQFLFGFFRLGILARLISHATLIGFTTAAAILIALTQVPALLGITSYRGSALPMLWNVLTHLQDIQPLTAAIGCATLIIVLTGRRIFPRFPIALALLVVGIVMSLLAPLQEHGVAQIGLIPSGLPQFSFAAFSTQAFFALFKQSFLLAIIGFVETYSIAKSISEKSGEHIDANKELIGQGVANITSGLVGGFPVSGSFSASALNRAARAYSRLSAVFVSFIILLSLLLLGPFLSLIPRAVLAGIVIAAVIQLVDIHRFIAIFSLSKTDGVIAATTAVTALIFQPDEALFIGICLGISFFVIRGMNLRVSAVGIHDMYGSLWAYEGAPDTAIKTFPTVLILRLDTSLIFANAEELMGAVTDKMAEHEYRNNSKVTSVILNFAGLNYVDFSGIESIEHLAATLKKKHIDLHFMLVKDCVWEDFTRAGLFKKVPYLHGIDELLAYCSSQEKIAPHHTRGTMSA